MFDDRRLTILRNLPIWKKRMVKISLLEGGMTNHNYLVEIGDKKYVARFAPSTTKLLNLNRAREIYNYRIAFSLGIGSKIIVHYPKYRLLIVEYLEGRILKQRSTKAKISL